MGPYVFEQNRRQKMGEGKVGIVPQTIAMKALGMGP
jgi:hypothetical protein